MNAYRCHSADANHDTRHADGIDTTIVVARNPGSALVLYLECVIDEKPGRLYTVCDLGEAFMEEEQ